MRQKVLFVSIVVIEVIILYFIIFSIITSRITIVRDSSNNKSWNIRFTNLEDVILKGTAQEINKPVINLYDTEISVYDVILHNPNDQIIYHFTITNDGDYNGVIYNINIPKPKCTGIGEYKSNDEINVCSHLHYTLTYENGIPVKQGDVLKKNESKKMVLSLLYDNEVKEEEIPKNIVFVGNLSVDINYVQCEESVK